MGDSYNLIKDVSKKGVEIMTPFKIPKELVLKMYDQMVLSRVIEERLIKIYKMGESYFWIGSPGEEAFGVPLGHLLRQGQGIEYDWLHLHYRATPTLVAMGMPMIDPIRQMMNRTTDVSSGGRNFCGHYCYPKWNVAPITSPIEVQYSIAIGTAWIQKKKKSLGITIVSGGDAGTAEGDFATCLVWSSRPGKELPILITVQNNRWGISTCFESQHGESKISDRGKAFGIRSETFNGNDLEESYFKLKESMEYIRKSGKPCLIEAYVSRLYGHSSASGANFVDSEVDCLKIIEEKILKSGWMSEQEIKMKRDTYEVKSRELADLVRLEREPSSESIWENIYADGTEPDWRKF